MNEIKAGDFAICLTDQGHLVENRGVSPIATHFNPNSVVEVRKREADKSLVYVIGRNEEFAVPNDMLRSLDPTKTGKGYSKKICNICHVLKPHSGFEVNQTDAKGGKTSRPSCRKCRRGIDKRKINPATLKTARRDQPPKGTLWRCPICRKRSIVGVTARIVLDHDHAQGILRGFLCDSCNTGLGRFKNGENYLKNAISYLKSFKQ